jgi:sulfate transport system permease protein
MAAVSISFINRGDKMTFPLSPGLTDDSVLPGQKPGSRFKTLLAFDGILPGFGLTIGAVIVALSLIVLIPLAALVLKASDLGLGGLWTLLTTPRVLSALRLSFGLAFIAAIINLLFGVLIAWVLVRDDFWGRKLIDAAIDLPFALPTAVAGIALSTLYAPNGWIGAWLARFNIKIGYTPSGILVALIFIGIPFVVRMVQPVLQEIEQEIEEAAALLGATPAQSLWRIVLPAILPAAMTGFILAFARAVGEYGSVIFIAGNIPMVSEVAPLLIVIKLEQFDYAGAAGVGFLMLLGSFALLLASHLSLIYWGKRHGHH